jgi:nickel-dependent lactate racemase
MVPAVGGVSMQVPLGDGTLAFELPECDVTVAEPPGGTAVDAREAATRAMASPNGPALSTRPNPDDAVTIVVTDVTRATPDGVLVDVLLDNLAAAGVGRDQVTVVVGLGLHRPLSESEIEDLLGEHADLAENHDPDAALEVGKIDADPDDPDNDDQVALAVNEAVVTADLVLSTGMVEPHQYAGFSGGAKTVVVGAGGAPLIRYTHGPTMLSQDGVRLGWTEGNPFRTLLDRAGDLVGPDFCLNVTHTKAGVLDAAAGNHRAVVGELANSAFEALSVPVDGAYDAVVAGVGAPKDANLYQASRAATYVVLGDRNPLRPGGRIVIPAELPEGAGTGTGEKRFHRRLRGAEDPASLYETMRTGYEPGAQRAFVTARVLRDHDVYVTNSRHPEVVEECLMHAREYLAEAVEPGSDVLVIPDALHTLLVDPD